MQNYFFLILLIPFCTVYAEDLWLSVPIIGEYRHWDPPKNPNVFNIQYKIVNGSIHDVDAVQSRVSFHIESNQNGLLEIKIPRNYPFTDYPQEMRERDALYIKIDDSNVNADSIDIKYDDDCFYAYAIPFSSNNSEIIIGYSKTLSQVLPYAIDNVPDHCIVNVFAQPPFPPFIANQFSPLTQIQLGTNPTDIRCTSDFVLIFKSSDDSPACVKPETKEKLIERGWAKT